MCLILNRYLPLRTYCCQSPLLLHVAATSVTCFLFVSKAMLELLKKIFKLGFTHVFDKIAIAYARNNFSRLSTP